MYTDYFKEERHEVERAFNRLLYDAEERITNPRIVAKQEVVGKTIKAIEIRDQVIILVFDDNSYYAVIVEYPCDIDERAIDEDDIYLDDTSRLSLWDLRAAGLTTPDLIAELESLQQQRLGFAEKHEQERDRQEYERLKAKFEGEQNDTT